MTSLPSPEVWGSPVSLFVLSTFFLQQRMDAKPLQSRKECQASQGHTRCFEGLLTHCHSPYAVQLHAKMGYSLSMQANKPAPSKNALPQTGATSLETTQHACLPLQETQHCITSGNQSLIKMRGMTTGNNLFFYTEFRFTSTTLCNRCFIEFKKYEIGATTFHSVSEIFSVLPVQNLRTTACKKNMTISVHCFV